MLNIRIGDQEISIQTEQKEVTLSQFIDFYKAETIYLNAVLEGEAGEEEMLAVLSTVCELPLNLNYSGAQDDLSLFDPDLTSISVIGIYNHYIELLSVGISSLVESVIDAIDREAITEEEKTVLSLYESSDSLENLAYLSLLISEMYGGARVIDGDFHLDYKGERFYICGDEVLRRYKGEQFTVGEVSIVKQFRKESRNRMKEKGDPDGRFAFAIGLYEISVLLKREGESVPSKPSLQRSWLKDRMSYWESIDLETYYSVCFFLTIILITYYKTGVISSLSKALEKKGLI